MNFPFSDQTVKSKALTQEGKKKKTQITVFIISSGTATSESYIPAIAKTASFRDQKRAEMGVDGGGGREKDKEKVKEKKREEEQDGMSVHSPCKAPPSSASSLPKVSVNSLSLSVCVCIILR